MTIIQSTTLGTVNPYCQLELENQFFRTQTELKTRSPNWDRQFRFSVSDAFSVLKITVFRKIRNQKSVQFLGLVYINCVFLRMLKTFLI